jgi:hypothetical protein
MPWTEIVGVLVGGISWQLSFNFVAALQLWAHFAEERPQDPLSHPCRSESQARCLRGLPELFAKGMVLVSICAEMMKRGNYLM